MSQDREFETYLRGEADLSRHYADLPQVEPPDHLDAAILAEGHRAVGSRPGAKPVRRWAIPLSLVASVLVVVMVGLQFPYMLHDAALPTAPTEERAAATMMDKAMPETAAAPAQKTRRAEQDAPRITPADVRGLLSAAPVAPASPAAAPPPAAAMAAEPQRLKEQAQFENEAVLAKAKKSSGRLEGNASDRLEQYAPAAARMAAPAPVQSESKPKEAFTKDAGDTNPRPEEWLARIKLLEQQGKLDEARKELAAFKKRYPQHPVPEALEVK
jgi:hypothetical protein